MWNNLFAMDFSFHTVVLALRGKGMVDGKIIDL
jgi:hypothetical protein